MYKKYAKIYTINCIDIQHETLYNSIHTYENTIYSVFVYNGGMTMITKIIKRDGRQAPSILKRLLMPFTKRLRQ